MTIDPFDGEKKEETKRRYFNELLECREALLCKAIDRYSNLQTMEGLFTEKAIEKNIKETYELLLPVMKKAKGQ